jgi:hypothetical protein
MPSGTAKQLLSANGTRMYVACDPARPPKAWL